MVRWAGTLPEIFLIPCHIQLTYCATSRHEEVGHCGRSNIHESMKEARVMKNVIRTLAPITLLILLAATPALIAEDSQSSEPPAVDHPTQAHEAGASGDVAGAQKALLKIDVFSSVADLYSGDMSRIEPDNTSINSLPTRTDWVLPCNQGAYCTSPRDPVCGPEGFCNMSSNCCMCY